MIPQIISNPEIQQRVNLIHKEMKRQHVAEYKLWPSIHIPTKPKRTGISKAHKQIVEWALIEQMPEVCIMEDDVWFPSEQGWQYFLDNKPQGKYDLYLAGISRGEINEENITKRYTGQFCYIIHEDFYTTFLRADENLDIDGAMSNKGVFYVCNPFAAFCYPAYSHHNSENLSGVMDYSHLLIGRDIYGFGKLSKQEDCRKFSSVARDLMTS